MSQNLNKSMLDELQLGCSQFQQSKLPEQLGESMPILKLEGRALGESGEWHQQSPCSAMIHKASNCTCAAPEGSKPKHMVVES